MTTSNCHHRIRRPLLADFRLLQSATPGQKLPVSSIDIVSLIVPRLFLTTYGGCPAIFIGAGLSAISPWMMLFSLTMSGVMVDR